MAPWKPGDPTPEGMKYSGVTEVAVQVLAHGLITRADLCTGDQVDELLEMWRRSVEVNEPDATAALIVMVAHLAAGFVYRVAERDGMDAVALVEAEGAAVEALGAYLLGGEAP